MARHWFRTTAVILLGLIVCSAAYCLDLGIESYSIVAPFGIATATTARQFGMGGPMASMWDVGFPNPAYAAFQSGEHVSSRIIGTKFAAGPQITSTQTHWATSFGGDRSGLQVTYYRLESNHGLMMTPVGPAVLHLSETDLAFDYGHRLGDRYAIGLSACPIAKRHLGLVVPGGPTILGVDAKSDIGARFGFAMQWGPYSKDFVGLTYDWYQDTAEGVGLALEGSAHRVFWNEQLAVGASRHLSKNLMVVAEYQTASSNDGDYRKSMNGWHMGGEWAFPTGAALRAGLNDGHPTFGFGFENARWSADYAYIIGMNSDVAAELLGRSDSHTAEVVYRW